MKKLVPAIALFCLCGGASADGIVPDPGAWYRDAYGPLWADNPGEKIDRILGFYAETIETHSEDGKISRTDKTTWLREPMEEWLADGWLSSELKEVMVDRINATTTSFKASWLDRYKKAANETSCGWYLADLQEGAWRFTAYADIDCADHDL